MEFALKKYTASPLSQRFFSAIQRLNFVYRLGAKFSERIA
jgi:hypothetical protein